MSFKDTDVKDSKTYRLDLLEACRQLIEERKDLYSEGQKPAEDDDDSIADGLHVHRIKANFEHFESVLKKLLNYYCNVSTWLVGKRIEWLEENRKTDVGGEMMYYEAILRHSKRVKRNIDRYTEALEKVKEKGAFGDFDEFGGDFLTEFDEDPDDEYGYDEEIGKVNANGIRVGVEKSIQQPPIGIEREVKKDAVNMMKSPSPTPPPEKKKGIKKFQTFSCE